MSTHSHKIMQKMCIVTRVHQNMIIRLCFH